MAEIIDAPVRIPVPGGKTIACSTERAMNWDASFASRAMPSPASKAQAIHQGPGTSIATKRGTLAAEA